jgi:endonuclease I
MRLLIMTLMVLLGTGIAYADPPRGYYEIAANKTGSDLKAALHAIIDGHEVLPYTESGNTDWLDGQNVDVWEALVYTDSACADAVPNCGLVRLLYLDESRHISKANRGSGKNDLWEREHVWPKSRGFKNGSQDGYTDLHHLRPADRNLNSKHSNYGYDVGGVTVMDRLADDSEVPTSAKFDMANESFEPTDQAKGQIARMIFYMAVRYEVGDDGGIEKMPDLVLKDKNERVKEPWIGDLCTLISWNNAFGPTDFERRRNDRIMELQANRNPFIDEPGWAILIWGDRCD